MKCQSIKPNNKKICIADLNKRIKILTSTNKPNNAPNTNSNVAFTTILTTWAMIKTNINNNFIDGVNVSNSNNTDFYVRYNSAINLSTQLYIEYDNILYKIDSSDNIDKSDDIIRLRASEKGDKNINANKR